MGVCADFLKPLRKAFEAVTPGDVIDNEGCDGALVVRTSDRLERLLAGCIPNLDLQAVLTDLNVFGGELHPQGRLMLGLVTILCELQAKAGLADIWSQPKAYWCRRSR